MDTPGTQTPKSFRWGAGRGGTIEYLLYLPADYDPASGRQWPLVLFLHGAGERGHDLGKVKRHGLPRVLAGQPDFPAIVVSPQCQLPGAWPVPLLNALLDEVQSKYAADPDRVYVTGLSLGGMATWALAETYPARFAAVVPICGAGNPAAACRMKDVPVWAFHGAKDDVVPVEYSEQMVDALRACGGNVRLTVYPDAGHDSWSATYANPELYAWLFSQRRAGRSKD